MTVEAMLELALRRIAELEHDRAQLQATVGHYAKRLGEIKRQERQRERMRQARAAGLSLGVGNDTN